MMEYADVGIMACANPSCQQERRCFVPVIEGATIALCGPCTVSRARSGKHAWMMSADDLAKREATQQRWERRSKESQRERRERRIREGMCIECGREPADGGTQRGSRCRRKHAQREQANRGLRKHRLKSWMNSEGA